MNTPRISGQPPRGGAEYERWLHDELVRVLLAVFSAENTLKIWFQDAYGKSLEHVIKSDALQSMVAHLVTWAEKQEGGLPGLAEKLVSHSRVSDFRDVKEIKTRLESDIGSIKVEFEGGAAPGWCRLEIDGALPCDGLQQVDDVHVGIRRVRVIAPGEPMLARDVSVFMGKPAVVTFSRGSHQARRWVIKIFCASIFGISTCGMIYRNARPQGGDRPPASRDAGERSDSGPVTAPGADRGVVLLGSGNVHAYLWNRTQDPLLRESVHWIDLPSHGTYFPLLAAFNYGHSSGPRAGFAVMLSDGVESFEEELNRRSESDQRENYFIAFRVARRPIFVYTRGLSSDAVRIQDASLNGRRVRAITLQDFMRAVHLALLLPEGARPTLYLHERESGTFQTISRAAKLRRDVPRELLEHWSTSLALHDAAADYGGSGAFLGLRSDVDGPRPCQGLRENHVTVARICDEIQDGHCEAPLARDYFLLFKARRTGNTLSTESTAEFLFARSLGLCRSEREAAAHACQVTDTRADDRHVVSVLPERQAVEPDEQDCDGL